MSRKLLAFLVSELSVVRIVCAKCRAASEVTVEQLSGGQSFGCRYCDTQMQAHDTLAALARSILFLKNYKGFEVEFVLPDTSGE